MSVILMDNAPCQPLATTLGNIYNDSEHGEGEGEPIQFRLENDPMPTASVFTGIIYIKSRGSSPGA